MNFESDIYFILGYLNQAKKSDDIETKRVIDILIFLCEKIKEKEAQK